MKVQWLKSSTGVLDMGTAEHHNTKPRINRARSRDDVIRDIRRINELSERVLDELCAISRAEGPSQRRRSPRPAEPMGPVPAVHNVHLQETSAGGAVLSFDGGKQITLPPTLAGLITVLVSDAGPSPDGFMAFKSFDLMGWLLEKRFGRGFSHHNISQLLTRLRKALRNAGLDPRLIESSPKLGVRLRLKWQSAGLCSG